MVIGEIIFGLAWFGISKLISIAIVRDVGYLVVFVAVIFAVAWYLPKLSPALYGFGTGKNTKQIKPRPRLLHDNVLWEDGGYDGWGYIKVIGPLCPKDYTPLAFQRGDKVDTNIKYNVLISNTSYYPQLVCLQCKTRYIFDETTPKTVQDSHDEVRVLFGGKRRREG
jgi:hypothetical protein